MPAHSTLPPASLHEAKRHKANVRAASTATVTLASAVENGDTLDGVTLATGDRILLKNQSTGAENGIYTVNASGAPTRATDCDAAAELFKGFLVYVEEGTVNATTLWAHTTTAAITLNTTALTFVQIGVGGDVATDAIWDAKGDLAAGTAANTASKLTVGANDTILMADSAQATGLKWVASQTPTTQAFSDVAAQGTADTYARGDHLHGMPASPGGGGAFCGARIYSTSLNYTVVTGTTTVVTWDAATYDTDSLFSGGSPTRLTIPGGKTGYWRISGMVDWTPNATGTRYGELKVNGSFRQYAYWIPNNGASADAVAVFTTTLALTAADYIELFVQQDSGITLQIAAFSDQYFYFQAEFLGA